MNTINSFKSKDPQVFLKHIFESIEWIEKFINGLTEDQLIHCRNSRHRLRFF